MNEFVARIGDEDRFRKRRGAAGRLLAAGRTVLRRARRRRAQRCWDDAERPCARNAGQSSPRCWPSFGCRARRRAAHAAALSTCSALATPTPACGMSSPSSFGGKSFYAVRTIIERRLALSPLLIVVEDLHWADAVSLEALRFVMDRLDRMRLMLLITHRPAMENDQLDSCRISHTALRLSPLGIEDGRRLLAALFGEGWAKSARGLRDRILDRAGGNPLFIEEIVRGLIEVGVLTRDGQQWRIAAGEAAPVFRPASRRCCSPASTGCRKTSAVWPRRPRLSARALTRPCSSGDSRSHQTGSGARTAVRCRDHRGGCRSRLGLVAGLPIYANAAAGRDLSESAPAAAQRPAWADRLSPSKAWSAKVLNGSRI